MNIVTKTAGRYLSVSSHYFMSGQIGPRLLPNRYDDPKTVASFQTTPTIFKITEHASAVSHSIDVPAIFYADDTSRDYMQEATSNRLHLGSVVYNDGIAHHEYNGVYHAKVDGSIYFDPQLDKADAAPSPGNPLIVNPFTGSSSDRVLFVSPGFSLHEATTDSGWNAVNNRYHHEVHVVHMAGLYPVNEHWYALFETSVGANLVSDTMIPSSDRDSRCILSFGCLLIEKHPNSRDFPERWVSNGSGFRPYDYVSTYQWWLVQKGKVPRDAFEQTSRERAFDIFLSLTDDALVHEFLKEMYGSLNPYAYNGYSDYRYTAVNAKVDEEELKRQFGGLTHTAESELLNARLDRHVDWSDLAFRAYQDIGMWNGNGIQYLADITHLTADTKRLVKTLKSLSGALKGKKLKAACKAASGLYLSIHYGIKLSVIDTKELAKVISSPKYDFGRKRCQAADAFVTVDQNTGHSWNVTARYQLMYNTKKSMDNMFKEYLRMLDVVPDLANLWDALPYSFCIDWFVKMGDLLESIDNYTQICSSYDVEAAGQSTKYTRVINPSELGISAGGEIHFSLYTRGYSRTPVIPIPSKLTTSTNPFTHSVEAGALLVSK